MGELYGTGGGTISLLMEGIPFPISDSGGGSGRNVLREVDDVLVTHILC